MISTIHKARMVNTGRTDRNTHLEIKRRPHCIVPYNKYVKGVDRAAQYLSYYSTVRTTVMSQKKVIVHLINCTFFVYKTLNRNRETKYKKFLHGFPRFWLLQTKNLASRRTKHEHLGRLSRDFSKHELEKTVTDGQERKQYPARQCEVCAKHKTQ